MKAAVALVLASAIVASTAAAHAEPARRPMPWDDLPANALSSLVGRNLVVYGAAVLSTGALAASGVDDRVHDFFLAHEVSGRAVDRAFFVGGTYVPVVLPAAVWAAGLLAGDVGAASAGASALQAAGVTVVVVQTLKLVTGRPLPSSGRPSDVARTERGTDVLSGGVAWPSGHTSSFFAIVAAAHAALPEKRWIALVGYPLAAAMGFQMVEGEHHWLSDSVAGALIGWSIGDTIGRAFRARYAPHEASAPTFHLVPFGAGGVGAGVFATF